MKNAASLILVAVGICSYAQSPSLKLPEWKVTLKVIDEAEQPVSDAEAIVGYIRPGTSSRMDTITGNTDTNGLFSASGRSAIRLYLTVKKSGYYSAGRTYDIGITEKARYEPWNPTIILLVKKIGKPVPMYAKRANLAMPLLGRPVGFDLATGDWVAPYGKGKNTDVIFTASMDKRAEDDWDSRLIVSFPNLGDGIQPFAASDLDRATLRSPHEAPEGGYEAQWVKAERQRPGQPNPYRLDENRNFFFRVRTVLDEKGNVRSANYGKIYGDFMNFRYYLNPEANSRNVEFDPAKNLLKHLGPSEHVDDP